MTSWDRVEKLLGADALAHLGRQTVGIIGLGSGGGFVAESLAMSGVGNFVLIDDEMLETVNVVRHVCDLRDVGRPKVEAVAELIRARNSAANVTAIQGRVEDHLDALEGLDLLVCGVDAEQSKYAINRYALAQGLTTVYAGVYEKGEGGDSVIIRPQAEDEPCYACWAMALREGLAAEPSAEELDYGMIGPDGTLKAEPGLWLHVVRIAAAQADLALNELLLNTPPYVMMPGNTVILANRPLEIFEGHITPPYSAEWVTVHRDPDCLECGQLARLGENASRGDKAGRGEKTSRGESADSTEDGLSLDDLMTHTGIEYEIDDEEGLVAND